MKINLIKQLSILSLGFFLVACQSTQTDSGESNPEIAAEESSSSELDHDSHDHDHEDNEEAPETIEIEGVEDHYHTGGLIELVAVMDEEVEHDHWHWFIRKDESSEWETVADQSTSEFVYEAPGESFEVRAILYSDDHEAYAQSAAVEVIVDNH